MSIIEDDQLKDFRLAQKKKLKKAQISDVQTFLNMVRQRKLSVQQFIYLVQQKNNQHDHYNMKIVRFNYVTKNQVADYYTCSAKGVTMYKSNTPVQFILIADWLNEKSSFNTIKQLRFFVNFRKWKTLKKWTKLISMHRIGIIRNILQQKLFIVHPLYQKILLKHSDLCCQVESLRFIQTPKIHDCLSLNQFLNKQNIVREQFSEQLQKISRKLHQNTQQGLQALLIKLKDKIGKQFQDFDEEGGKKGKHRDSRTMAIASLGFPQSMQYGSRALMRNQFVRFVKLSYLLEFMAAQSLGKAYICCGQNLIDKLIDLNKNTYNQRIPQLGKKLKRIQNPEAFFQVEFDLNTSAHCQQQKIQIPLELEDRKIAKKEIDFYFDPLYHPTAYRIFNPSPLITLIPKQQQFIQSLISLFKNSTIQRGIKSWRGTMDVYIMALQQWDDVIRRGKQQGQIFVDPGYWIKQNKFYKRMFKGIKDQIRMGYNNLLRYKQQHNSYMQLYYLYSKTSFQSIPTGMNSELFEKSMNNSYLLLEKIEQVFLEREEVGLYQANSKQFKKKVIHSHENYLNELAHKMMTIFVQSSKQSMEWLELQNKNIGLMAQDIQEHAIQRKTLQRINTIIPQKRDQIDLNRTIVTLLQEKFPKMVHTNHTNAVQKLNTLQSTLNSTIMDAQSNAQKNMDKFKKSFISKVQKFNQKAKSILDNCQQLKYIQITTQLDVAVEQLTQMNNQMKTLQQLCQKYQQFQQLLQLPQPADFDILFTLKQQLGLRYSLWKGIKEIRQLKDKWQNLPFRDIQARAIIKEVQPFIRIVNKTQRNLPDNKVVPMLKKIVWEYRQGMPIAAALKSQYMKQEHWAQVKEALPQKDFDIEDQNFTLRNFLDLGVVQYKDQLLEISAKANQQYQLKLNLTQVQELLNETQLIVKNYKEYYVMGSMDQTLMVLDQSLANVNNVLANRYVQRIRSRAQSLSSDIQLLMDIIQKWAEAQKKWMYLQNIFIAPDIRKNMPQESKQFQGCDKFIKYVMKNVARNNKLLKLLKINNIFDNLTKTALSLQKIEKQLQDYLEVKRRLFPRFYFLSNDQLLEILAKSANLQATQQHLGKCFQGLVKLYMGIDKNVQTSNLIQGMISPQKEVVPFTRIFPAKGNIQLWLLQLQKQMFDAVKKLIKNGLTDYLNGIQRTKIQWILAHKSQAVATVSQILWTLNTQEAIKEMNQKPQSLNQHLELSIAGLQSLTLLVRGTLTPTIRKIIVALITTQVHNRDIETNLSSLQISSLSDFNWQQQLRYYLQNEQCIVRQVTSVVVYGYQYLGATSRLVITPLTDRCWITITSAISLNLGANPAGPAGTGKTQSVKDLAKGVARMCIVFNCSDQITAAMMNKLFKGLAQQGAWSCLDQFNRIDIEVLSVIAQQLLIIRIALNSKTGQADFDGILYPIRSGYGCFITMNPGYAGRTQLPDNLKSLFRPVSMMIPDYAMIAQIMLFAEGFQDASTLSKKMVQLYKLSSEQLSQQDHYDFGMRAVKSLLVMAGSLKRNQPNLNQDTVLIRAMKQSNIPKFLKQDIPLFTALIYDLFPTIQLPKQKITALQQVLPEILAKDSYQPDPAFITKINQLYQTLNVRFGVMLVGQTGCGKSVAINGLKNSMCHMKKQGIQGFQMVQYRVINPKSITMGELYGQVDPFTQQWNDGLASSIIRQVNTSNIQDPHWDPNQRYWVVFDGPVDALWIQNMNTVLDDTQTLCLANSERIKLRSQLRMLFQVQDLAVASPATVSRCGMVFYSFDNLHWSNYLKRWIQIQLASQQGKPKISQQLKKQIQRLFERTLEKVIIKKKHMYQAFPTTPIQSVQNVCRLLYRMLIDLKPGQNEAQTKKRIYHYYIFSFIWGALGSVSSQNYHQVQKLVKECFDDVIIPRVDTIFDFFVHEQNQKSFLNWSSKVPDFQYNKGDPFFSLLVPTIQTIKYSYIIELMLDIQTPIIISGESGVGKSVIVSNLLNSIKESKKVNSIFLNFSAQTKSKQTQIAIESKLNKKGKTAFGARPNQKIAIFVDDINMPALQFYGAQPCIQLLRYFVDKGCFYDRSKLFLKHISDTTLISACAPPGGGRNMITPRFLRHMLALYLPLSPTGVLQKIFSSLLSSFLTSSGLTLLIPLSQSLILCTINLFMKISKELLPTPSKFHYLFNLRDMAKIVQGMMSAKVRQQQKLVKLWVHESMRIFTDRFVDQSDLVWFKKVLEQIRPIDEGIWSTLWTDILKLDSGNSIYQQLTDKKRLVKILQDKQLDYNTFGSDKMDLVFFDDAIEQILRISRILRHPRGNAMLIGVGGSGKQSLAKLSSFIMKCQPYQIELIKNYNNQSFRGDLQKLASKTGGQFLQVSFIFTDVQIAYQSFLQDINNLLNTGQVPNLFPKKQQVDELINMVRPVALKNKIQDSPEPLWTYFIQSIRNNLHIILCMSPVGQALRVRCRKFPSLVNCCTLDWFPSWSSSALLQVANKFVRQITFSKEGMFEKISEMCRQASIDVNGTCQTFLKQLKRHVYTTPKSYLDQIKLYTVLLEKKREDKEFIKRKLSNGLEKLYSTNQTVGTLKVEMVALQPQLAEQSEKTQLFLKQLAIDSEEAAKVQLVVQQQAEVVNMQAGDIKLITDQAQAQLKKALPALKQAQDALNSLNKNDITQIKGFANPPSAVVMVLQAVCILLGQKTDWNSAKQVMIDINFLERLKTYNRQTMTDNIAKKVRKITEKQEFTPALVGKQSIACKSLCLWCRAMDNYYRISREVEPKKKKVAEMQAILNVKNKQLKIKQAQLKSVKDKVAKLQKQCDDTMALKKKLQDDMERTAKRLVAAQKLTVLLADQGVRWKQQIGTIGQQITNLIGDVFMSAATISYLGPFTGMYRQPLIKKWMQKFQQFQIPYSQTYSLSNTLQTPIKIREWNLQGLPSDSVSVDNAVIVTKCQRFPLLIDPQGEANKWIKKHQPKNTLKLINFSDTHYLKTIQTSITSGYPVLLQNVQQRLQPSIDSVLQKQIYSVDGRNIIRVGDKKLDYNPNFFFYITTKMSNPHYLPQIYIKVTVINFSITFDGLKQQLLGQVMKHQLPDIEKQRDQIVVSIAESKKQIKESQDKILELLAQATGMILDDVQLIKTLERSKISSAQIKKNLQQTSAIQAQINQSRNLYIPVSIRGTVLYFVITDLSLIDPMYQYSLAYFKKLFRIAMSETEKAYKVDKRLENLNYKITCNIFVDICRGLFESHKKIYSYLICTSIKRQKEEISQVAWNLMVRGAPATKQGQKIKVQNPDPAMFDANAWNLITFASQNIVQLYDVNDCIKSKLSQWKKYITCENIITSSPPQPYDLVSPFSKLLLVKGLSSSKVMKQISNFVGVELGKFFQEVKSTTMEEIFLSSDCKTPAIFILSQGADPTAFLLKFAGQKSKVVSVISLGQGQGRKATNLIDKNKKDGGWVLLQNCHLARSWMADLQKLVLKFAEQKIHQNFRLFLTSMPADFFPVAVLQNGIKLTTQPPRGIRANLKRSYQQFSQQFMDSCHAKPQKWKRLLFSLGFFHAIIQQRRKFGPLGFNIRYEFNDSDQDIAALTLRMFLNDQSDQIPWQALLYMTGHINYGGRVTDDWDRVCLLSILKQYYCPQVLMQQNLKFSPSGIYYCVDKQLITDYRSYINSLPNFDDPEVFGMHQNANITFQTQESNKIIDTVLIVQPRISSGTQGKTPDQIVILLAKEFLQGLPQLLLKEQGNEDHFEINQKGNMSSLSIVLLQQMQKFNILLKIMRQSLVNIQKAIQGIIVMSQDLDQMHIAFLNNQLPPIWKKKSYASLKPLYSWYKDLQARVIFLDKWLKGRKPTSYWMSGFYFPQGFLTGVLQTHSRSYKIPIDTLSFKFRVTGMQKQKLERQPNDGVYVHGLFFDGARWDQKDDTIIDQVIGKLYFPMSVLHFLPTENYVIPEFHYKCPCYKTSIRAGMLSTTGQSTNFILGVDLPSKNQKPQFWTLRGTALLCQLDY